MNFSNLPILETERLILRPITRDDAKDIFDYASDPEVAYFTRWSAQKTIADSYSIIDQWLDAYAHNTPAPWGIVDKATNKLIGAVGLNRYNSEDFRGELGYVLNKEHWGKGLVVEAVCEIFDYFFSSTEIHRIYAFCNPGNTRSCRVLEKVGMTYEGMLREGAYKEGHFSDHNIYAMIKPDWQKNKRTKN